MCPKISESWLKEKQEEDPWGYRQEYEVEFLDDTTAWLPMKLLTERVIDKTESSSLIPEYAVAAENVVTGHKYAHLYGCDLGKIKSHSVIVIIRKEPGGDGILRYRLVYLHEFPLVMEETTELYQNVEDWTYKMGRVFRLERGCVDATNNLAFTEKIRQKLPMIEPIRFSEMLKQDMMSWLRRLCEQHRLIIPYDARLVNQMNAQQFETRGDKLIFSPPLGPGGKPVPDDQLWALALALYADRAPDAPPLVMKKL